MRPPSAADPTVGTGHAHGQRDWLRRYVDKVIIHPNRPGIPRHWFDPAIVEVIPGPWWTAGRAPAPRPLPWSAPRGAAPALRLPGCGGVHDARLLPPAQPPPVGSREGRAPGRVGPGTERPPGPPRPGHRPRGCDLPGCGKPHEGHGLCNMHGLRAQTAERNGTPDGTVADPAAQAPPAEGKRGEPGHTRPHRVTRGPTCPDRAQAGRPPPLRRASAT